MTEMMKPEALFQEVLLVLKQLNSDQMQTVRTAFAARYGDDGNGGHLKALKAFQKPENLAGVMVAHPKVTMDVLDSIYPRKEFPNEN